MKKSKITQISNKMAYKCQLCDESFTNNRSFIRHCKEKHFPQNVKCRICGKSFANIRKLRVHLLMMHRETSGEIKIKHNLLNNDNTSSFLKSPSKPSPLVQRHYRTRTLTHGMQHQKKQEIDENLKEKIIIQKSEITKNVKQTVYKCPLCYKCFGYKRSYAIHNIEKHFPENVKCKICGNTFVSKRRLQMHLLIHKHNGYSSSASSSEMSPSDQSSTESPTHIFQRKRRKSLRKVNKKNKVKKSKMIKKIKKLAFECQICDEHFASKQSLVQHQNEQHQNKQHFPQNVECKICGKTFDSIKRLKTHFLKIHHTIPEEILNIERYLINNNDNNDNNSISLQFPSITTSSLGQEKQNISKTQHEINHNDKSKNTQTQITENVSLSSKQTENRDANLGLINNLESSMSLLPIMQNAVENTNYQTIHDLEELPMVSLFYESLLL